MEGGPVRLMNLADVANRIEKLISDAHQNCERITEAGDILLGSEPTDASNKADAPGIYAKGDTVWYSAGGAWGMCEGVVKGISASGKRVRIEALVPHHIESMPKYKHWCYVKPTSLSHRASESAKACES